MNEAAIAPVHARTMRAALTRANRSTPTRALLSMLLTVLMLVTAVLAPSAASAATSPRMDFSADGRNWTERPDPLFNDSVLTPGAGTTASLWVRHHGPDLARLSVAAADEDLARWFNVQVNEGVLAPGETWLGPVLEPGDPFRLEFHVSLDAGAPMSVRNRTAHLLSHLSIRAVPGDETKPATPGTPSAGHGLDDHVPDEGGAAPAPGLTGDGAQVSGSAGNPARSEQADIGNRAPSALTVAGAPAMWLLAVMLLLIASGWTLRRRSRQG